MESFKMQQKRQQEKGEQKVELKVSQMCVEMVKGLMPKYEFKGEAAQLVGLVGMQPELAVICRCCGEGERKKTLICDACESSFHLKCLKLRSSDALLLDCWVCADCSALGQGRISTSSINVGIDKRSPPSKSAIPSHVPIALQPMHLPEDGASKIRFVFKLKTDHFKGARALANKKVEKGSDRSTEESTDNAFDSSKWPTCQMETSRASSAAPAIAAHIANIPQPCQPTCTSTKELIGLDGIQMKRAKIADLSEASKMSDTEDDNSSKLQSCQMECLTSVHQHEQAGLDIHLNENVNEEHIGASVVQTTGLDIHSSETVNEELIGASALQKTQENMVDDLGFERDTENISALTSRELDLGSVGEYKKQIGDACLSGGASENPSEAELMEEKEKRELDDKMADKVDAVENATQLVTDRQMKLVVADALPNHNGYIGIHGRVDKDTEESRSLVRVLDDVQKQHWHEDAIDLMDLEPSVCSKDSDVDHDEAVISPLQHLSRVHVRLNTARLLQAYADCRERCIIVCQMGRTMEANVDVSQGIDIEAYDIPIERIWILGEGFYVLLLGSKEVADEVILRRTFPFQGGIGYAIPFVPCFSPKQELQNTCPVWVTFTHLPIYFRPFLHELATSLGKVLYIPSGEALENSDSPRVCICWRISMRLPEFLLVEMEGLGSKKLKIEFDTSVLRHLSEFSAEKEVS